jgi:hypothetical protein
MSKVQKTPKAKSEMRSDYDFDYRRARPNRFASKFHKNVVTVLLDPDVAKVFDNSDSVNTLLRSVISAIPKGRRAKAHGARDRSRRKSHA